MKLRFAIAEHIYKDVYEKIDVLKGQSKAFLSWICPLLQPRLVYPQQSVFYKGDPVDRFYFVQKGACAYVLPRYRNQPYLTISDGGYFGFTDIISSVLNEDEMSLDNWNEYQLRRQFTVRCNGREFCQLLGFSLENLHQLKTEFSQTYDLLFENGLSCLLYTSPSPRDATLSRMPSSA